MLPSHLHNTQVRPLFYWGTNIKHLKRNIFYNLNKYILADAGGCNINLPIGRVVNIRFSKVSFSVFLINLKVQKLLQLTHFFGVKFG